tara:strand:- start:1029 stop:1592 length:564 start_codon:yes stop_codon:yes gene_type:complete
MQVLKTKFKELYVLTPEVFYDDRGHFFESFNSEKFSRKFNALNFCQDNESKSMKNIIRGLHFQIPPFDQTKLVRVIYGSILDVAVDLRKHSNTYGKYYTIQLDDKNKKQLLVPSGFAHGFLTLSNECIVNYKVDKPYSKNHERGIIFSDNNLNIDWGINLDQAILSDKDYTLGKFNNLKDYFTYSSK